jgi:transaldolase
MISSDVLAELSAAGVAVWLDDINRKRLTSGNLAALARDRHVVGVTSNPTIFDHALSHGDLYNEQLAELALRGVSVGEASRAITAYDVRWACDVLRPAYDASGGVDGRVSLEVDPRLAGDTEKTIAEARALWWLVDRPNLFIKIPATPAGAPIAQCLAEGSINATLIFRWSATAGGRRSSPAWSRPQKPRPVLDGLGGVVLRQPVGHRGGPGAGQDRHPGGRRDARPGAIANARLAYELFEQRFAPSSPRWAALHAKGVRLQRPLWASTSTKDPAYPDTMYVVELVAPNVVNTMPEATILAVADHGELRGDTVRGTYQQSRKVFEDLAGLDISYDDVVTVLEEEGVTKFAASWQELLETISAELERR